MKTKKIAALVLALLILLSCVPISVSAEEETGEESISEVTSSIGEYESVDGAEEELAYVDDSEQGEDNLTSEVVDQKQVESNLDLTVGAIDTEVSEAEEQIEGQEEAVQDDNPVLDDLVEEEPLDEDLEEADVPAEDGDIETDLSLVFINSSCNSLKVNIGNYGKITLGYIGIHRGSVRFRVKRNNNNINGSWGNWSNHKVPFNLVGRQKGTTILTFELLDASTNRVLATKKITVTVVQNATIRLSNSALTIYKGKSSNIGVTLYGTTAGMQLVCKKQGSSVSANWNGRSGSTKYVRVYGNSVGSTRLNFYLYSENGTLLLTRSMTVSVVTAPSITLSESSGTADIGAKKTFMVTANNVYGRFYFNYSINNGKCVASWGNWRGSTIPLVVTGKDDGTSTITIRLYSSSNELLATKTISFRTRENPQISCNDGSPVLKVGNSRTLTLSYSGINSSVYFTGTNSNGDACNVSFGKYSGNSIALNIKANKKGSSTLTIYLRRASNNSIAATYRINVTVQANPSISVSPSTISIKAGQQTTITATAKDIKGNYKMAFSVSGKTVTCNWQGKIVNNKASILVKATKKGKSTITVYLKDESGATVATTSIIADIQKADDPKVNASSRAVDVTQGHSESVKVTYGGVSGNIYLTATTNNDCVSCTWGSWSIFGSNTLTISGKKLGDTSITIKLVRSSDNRVMASETVNVSVWADTGLINSLSYSFDNYSAEIPLSTFVRAFGANTKSARLYDNNHYAGGLCYGFAVTSMLMQQGYGISPSSFGKSSIWNLKKNSTSTTYNMNVDSFIKWMFITQYSTIGTNSLIWDLNSLCNYVKNGGLARVKIVGSGGHAVVAYKFDDAHGRLYICDSNWPGAVRYITVGKNSSGKYTSWSYNLFGNTTWGSTVGKNIAYQALSSIKSQWDNRESLNVHSSWISENLLITNSDDFVIYDIEDNVVATYSEGVLDCAEDAAYLVEVDGFNPNAEYEDNQCVLVYLPTDFYTVKNKDEDINSFHAEMISTELGVAIHTDADVVSFGVDDAYDLCSTYIDLEAGEQYEVQLLSSREGERNITVNGMGVDETVTLGLSLENGECTYLNTNGATVNIDGTFENGYTINASAGEGGSIAPVGNNQVLEGGKISFKIQPDSCHEIEDVLVNGESVGAVEEYMFFDVDADATIEAVFSEVENAHQYVKKETVHSTCTIAGYDLFECTLCGAEKKEDLPLADHVLTTTVVEPTCTEGGYTLHECANCDYSIKDTLTNAKGHSYAGSVRSATCTEEGYSEGRYCSVCKAVFEEPHSIPALGHVDNNEDGKCDRCGTQMGSVPMSTGGSCKYCGKDHTGFFGGIIQLFHNILYFFKHPFGK